MDNGVGNLIVELLKKNFYTVLLVVSGISVLITYLIMRGGDSSESNLSTFSEDVSPGFIAVDISGAVEYPGVYKLLEGSLIVDLLKEAGGALTDASLDWVSKNLNLSEKLADSQKVYIPFDWEIVESKDTKVTPLASGASSTGAVASNSLINVNSATQGDLESLPRVGEVTAQRIIANRPYVDLTDLENRAELSAGTVEEIKELIQF